MVLIPDSSNSVAVFMLKFDIPIALHRPHPLGSVKSGVSKAEAILTIAKQFLHLLVYLGES